MKPMRHAVAYVIYRPGDMNRNDILIVKRPDDDPDLPGVWGLPAVSVRNDESFELAVRRAGRQKLGVILDFDDNRRDDGFVGRDVIEMENCLLHMEVYEARIVRGEPFVPQLDKGVTQYVGWKWGTASDIYDAANKGSLCSRIYLEHASDID